MNTAIDLPITSAEIEFLREVETRQTCQKAMAIEIPQETLNEWEARDARFRANGWTEDAITSWYKFVKVAEIQSLNKPKDPKPEESATYQDWAKTVSVKENVVDGLVKSRLVTFSDGYTSYRIYPEGEEPKYEEFDESKPIVF